MALKDLEIVIQALISSRLDYCNGLYLGSLTSLAYKLSKMLELDSSLGPSKANTLLLS